MKPIPEIIDEFRQFLAANGVEVPGQIVPDGEFHRADIVGDRKGRGDVSYKLMTNGEAAWGGLWNHKEFGVHIEWRPNRVNQILDPEQKRKMEQAVAALRASAEAKAALRSKRAAEQASKMWSEARPAEHNHPYLARKGVKAHEIKVGTWKGVENTLMIPVTDGENFLSMQFIFPDKHAELGRDKDFLPGGKKAGGFFPIGDQVHDAVVLCEGYATGATIYEATGMPVVVAFDATNMPAVALNIRALHPLAEIIVAADNDHHTAGNPGLQAADKVLQSVGNARIVQPAFDDSDAGTDWNDYAQQHGQDAVRQFFGMRKADSDLFVSVGDLVGNLQPICWLVEDYIEQDSLALVFGAPGGGKSFVTVDLACCVATGTPWHGHAVDKGAVFYIAGEGHNGLARRFAAWQQHNGVALKEAQLYKSKRAISVFNEQSAQDLYQAVKDIAEASGESPKLVILDTVARNFGDGDENSTQDMGTFVENIDKFVREPFGCNVLLVHHSGHNMERARGSSALKAALDAEYQVVNDAGLITLSATKMKDAEPPTDMAFRFKHVDLGEIDGVEIGSVVLEQQADTLDIKVGVNLDGDDITVKQVLNALKNGWVSGDVLKDVLNTTDKKVRTIVQACAAKGFLEKDGRGYKVSERAKQSLSLTGANLVRKDNTPVWKRGD